jgi:hypothetical protein
MNQLLRKQGKKLSAQLDINMPWNHPVGPENLVGLNSEERTGQLESAMQRQLDGFSQAVAARAEYIPADTGADHALSWGMKVFDLLVPKALNYSLHDYMYQSWCGSTAMRPATAAASVRKSSEWANRNADKKPRWNGSVRCYAVCLHQLLSPAGHQVESRFPIQSATTVNGYHANRSATKRSQDGEGGSRTRDRPVCLDGRDGFRGAVLIAPFFINDIDLLGCWR